MGQDKSSISPALSKLFGVCPTQCNSPPSLPTQAKNLNFYIFIFLLTLLLQTARILTHLFIKCGERDRDKIHFKVVRLCNTGTVFDDEFMTHIKNLKTI